MPVTAGARRRDRLDLHRRIADHLLHLRVELRNVLIRQRPDVESGFGFRRDHVGADAGFQHGRNHRSAQHRVSSAARSPQIALCRRGAARDPGARCSARPAPAVLMVASFSK